MRTAAEFAGAAHDELVKVAFGALLRDPGDASAADEGRMRDIIARACEAHHAARCKEALGEGPDCEKVEEARRWLARQKAAPGGTLPGSWKYIEAIFKALDHARTQCAALDGKLCDLLADQRTLVEEGRRRERAEIIAKMEEVAAELQKHRDHHGHIRGDAILVVARHVLPSRGPAPDPMPGDLARARVRELEGALRRIAGPAGRLMSIHEQIAREVLGEAT